MNVNHIAIKTEIKGQWGQWKKEKHFNKFTIFSRFTTGTVCVITNQKLTEIQPDIYQIWHTSYQRGLKTIRRSQHRRWTHIPNTDPRFTLSIHHLLFTYWYKWKQGNSPKLIRYFRYSYCIFESSYYTSHPFMKCL